MTATGMRTSSSSHRTRIPIPAATPPGACVAELASGRSAVTVPVNAARVFLSRLSQPFGPEHGGLRQTGKSTGELDRGIAVGHDENRAIVVVDEPESADAIHADARDRRRD